MLRLSFPLGRFMGVDVRLHLSFLILLAGAVAYGQAVANSAWRGLGLFAALALAVAVREIARAIAAAYLGMRLRALFLLPVGGVMAFAPQELESPVRPLPLIWAAPIANFAVGLVLLGLSYACAPGVKLLSQPWISPAHVLRAFVWMQFMLGLVNLLPAATLPTRQMLRLSGPAGAKAAAAVSRLGGPAFSLVAALAFAMLLAGIVTMNLMLVLLGCFMLLGSQLQSQTAGDAASGADNIRVEDVMLTEFTTLSSSDTLRGALERSVHSLQDVFPVLRGARLVGWVSRGMIADHLSTGGDSYVQGIMTKTMHPATAAEPLMAALRRAGAQGTTEFIPVVDADRLLGMLNAQNLPRAVHHIRQTRPPVEAREPR